MKKSLIYLKYLMPLLAVLAFALYLMARSVFFINDGEVKRRQSFKTLAASTYAAAEDRLDRLEREEEPDEVDLSFAKRARGYVIACRVCLGVAFFFAIYAAGVTIFAISLPPQTEAALNCKFMLRLVLPRPWLVPCIPLLCLPYACLARYICRLYAKFYLYDVSIGYHGLSPATLLAVLTAICFLLYFAAKGCERELKMDPYRRM